MARGWHALSPSQRTTSLFLHFLHNYLAYFFVHSFAVLSNLALLFFKSLPACAFKGESSRKKERERKEREVSEERGDTKYEVQEHKRHTEVGVTQKVAKSFQNISDGQLRRPSSTQDLRTKLSILRVNIGVVDFGVKDDLNTR